MVLTYSDSIVSAVRDRFGNVVGIWVKETVTWDGTETSYSFPNDTNARNAMQGYLWRLKSWLHTTAGVGEGHYFYIQMIEPMQDPAATLASHVIGRFLWADTEAYGQIYDNGALHDGKTAWNSLLIFTADTAPTNTGTSDVLVFYERVD